MTKVRPHRIVHVVRQFHPAIGGLEEGVMNLVQRQRCLHGLDASVVTLDRVFSRPQEVLPHHEQVSGVPVRRIGWTGSRRYPIAPAVLACIRNADLVHVHGIDFFFDYLAITRPMHRKPMVATTHGGFFHTNFMSQLKTAWFHLVTRSSLRAYRAMIACSDNDARQFAAIGGKRVVTIENGIDLDKFAGCAAQTPQRRLIYFGRLSINKRIGVLFGLLAELRRREPDWELIVAGRPDDIDWPQLLAEAQREGVADRVTYLQAPENVELQGAIGRSSYFACASAYEGFGLAAVEALSAGLVPVLSEIPPFRKLLRKVPCGVPLDPDGLGRTADSLERLHACMLAEPQALRSQCIDAARPYDWSAVAQDHVALYRRAIPVQGSDA